MPRFEKIILDGVKYKSVDEAVRKNPAGLSRTSIVNRLRKVAEGTVKPVITSESLQPATKVVVNGVEYPSINEAHRKTSISLGRLQAALAKAPSNRIKLSVAPVRDPVQARKISVNGVIYRNSYEAADVCGLTFVELCEQVRRQHGRRIVWPPVTIKPEPTKPLPGTPKEVVVNNKPYSSMVEAELQLGISHTTLQRLLLKSPDGKTIEYKKNREKVSHLAVKVVIDGVTYPSKAKAAAAIGMSVLALNELIKKHGLELKTL